MSATSTNKDRILLYEIYCAELDSYDEIRHAYPDDMAKKVARAYLTRPGFEWIDIFDDDQLVGFLIIGRDLDVHGEGFYLCEAFVDNKHRRRRLMTKAVTEALKGYHGTVYFEIFRRNLGARAFWEKVFADKHAAFIAEREIEDYKCLHEFVYLVT